MPPALPSSDFLYTYDSLTNKMRGSEGNVAQSHLSRSGSKEFRVDWLSFLQICVQNFKGSYFITQTRNSSQEHSLTKAQLPVGLP